MLFNIYTDFLYLRTKNYWHLIFLFFTILLAVSYQVSVIRLLEVGCITLFIGLIRENINFVRISAGDTKMIINASMLCFLLNQEGNVFYTAFFVHIFTFICSALLTGCIIIYLFLKSFIKFRTITGYHTIRIKKLNISLVTDGWQITSMYYCLPAAISVLGGVIPLILILIN